MGTETKIEWADSTWSPWRGCTKVSPGCLNCYAETLAKRNPAVLGGWGKGAPRVLAKNWSEPMRWQKRTSMDMPRHRVFPSLCDWLDEEVSPAWLAEFLALINLTPNLDWLLLTKRPENWMERIDAAALASTAFHQRWLVEWLRGQPPANVWFGVSVEDQTRADERIPLLREIPAELRWLSVEPLLGPINIEKAIGVGWETMTDRQFHKLHNAIEWVVVGGESGFRARPCDAEWIRSIISQCKKADVPVFVKQVGSFPVDRSVLSSSWGNVTDRKGGDPHEWPSELRVRQFPSLGRR